MTPPQLPPKPSKEAGRAYREEVVRLSADNPEGGGPLKVAWLIDRGLRAAYAVDSRLSLDQADEEALENAINYCRGAPLPDELVAGLERVREKLRRCQEERGD